MSNKDLLIDHLRRTNPYKAPEHIYDAADDIFSHYPIEVDDFLHEEQQRTLLQCLRNTETSQRALKIRIKMLYSVEIY
ncbi:hypothetical protein PYH62_09855 [Staphylococcus hominis]|nr:hypothetical protein PYH62_09855 [Staphylococcus hominis]